MELHKIFEAERERQQDPKLYDFSAALNKKFDYKLKIVVDWENNTLCFVEQPIKD